MRIEPAFSGKGLKGAVSALEAVSGSRRNLETLETLESWKHPEGSNQREQEVGKRVTQDKFDHFIFLGPTSFGYTQEARLHSL